MGRWAPARPSVPAPEPLGASLLRTLVMMLAPWSHCSSLRAVHWPCSILHAQGLVWAPGREGEAWRPVAQGPRRGGMQGASPVTKTELLEGTPAFSRRGRECFLVSVPAGARDP